MAKEFWWVLQGSNLRPTACKAVALPTELNTLGQIKGAYVNAGFVGVNANHPNLGFIRHYVR